MNDMLITSQHVREIQDIGDHDVEDIEEEGAFSDEFVRLFTARDRRHTLHGDHNLTLHTNPENVS